MKYIKTKDGIHELMFPNVEQQMSFDHKTIEPAYYTTKNDWVAKKDVIKEADTIEELCDYCFVFRKLSPIPIITNFYGAQHYIECFVKKTNGVDPVTKIKGAILTNKGIIYVAEMNEKGELELL